ncbi:hypothetical protein MCUN1_003935 [Malassezia cuniculi]|uniref:AAA+ ATPase domain-containing protein n=1 Tax=Malassezia cuniculi TaxID=948313 RepID=A0AAF0F2H9_9BASI|nr:hypothetical protein MCUN1_003935 [Malassezia cuniculi]
MRQGVCIEVRRLPDSAADPDEVRQAVRRRISEGPAWATSWREDDAYLAAHVDKIVVDGDGADMAADDAVASARIYVYQPCIVDNVDEFSVGDPSEALDTVAASVSELPSRALDGLWESLIYSDRVKWDLLEYIHTTLVFGDAQVDPHVIGCNRLVLLHGPPGTGKTSLCRALAQKLAIRLGDRYTHGKLVEINSHSLFSKWFSESGKLVQRLFEMVTELVDDQDGFVVVLIDEIESLTKARASAAAGVEPSDSLRVVNALLTQLDRLKQRTNALVMTTSNLTEAIDPAFLDRADIRQYIGPPGPHAIYSILRSCIHELVRKGLAHPSVVRGANQTIPTWQEAQATARAAPQNFAMDPANEAAAKLYALAGLCSEKGTSGRSLRRLPVIAHARYLSGSTVLDWIAAVSAATQDL